MAKNTHSQEVLTGTADSFTNHEISDVHPPYQVQRAMLGVLIKREGDEELVGTDSSEHSWNEPPSSALSKANLQGPAQTTESLSSQTDQDQEASSVRLTGGAGQGTVKPRSGRKSSTPRTKANVRVTGNDDDEFDEFD